MQKIRIDFDNPGLPQHISAVENDSQSRFFQATLYENGKAYTAPEGATYSIMYHGFGPQNQGWYDTINDGAGKRAACAVSGNVVTCEIARQALQVPGHVSIVLCVTTGKGYMLKSWPIECDCKNDRYDSTAEIQSFFYVTQVSNADWNRAIQALEELKNTIDPTLSLPGKAADAKATGDAVGALKEDLEDIGIYKKEDLPAYMGGIAVNKGSYVAAIEYIDVKNRLRTINKITSYAEAFLLKAGKKYLVTVKDGYVYALQLFDSIGGVALLDFKYRSDDYKIEYDRDVYAAFMLKKIDESDMNVSEMSNVSLIQYDNIGEQLNVANKRETIALPFDEDKIKATIYKDNNGYYTDFNVKNCFINKKDGINVFLSPDGDDENDGLSIRTPKKTIAGALSVKNIQTLLMAEGVYKSGENFIAGEEIEKSINIIGLGNVVIDNGIGEKNAPICIKNSCYIESLQFLHGYNTLKAVLSENKVIALFKCIFSGSDMAENSNGLSILGGTSYVIGCKAYNNAFDGLNYHANNNIVNHTLEVNCESYNNGSSYLTSDAGQSSNATTSHDGSYIVRLNGKYYACHGGVVADKDCKSANYGCSSGISTITDANYPDRMSNYWTSNSEMYLYNCESYGSKYDTAVIRGGIITSDTEYPSKYTG